MNRTVKTNESGLRAMLNIPPGAEKVLILSQSSHLDWDWLLPFPILFDNSPQTTSSYFSTNVQPASVIFTDAASFLCPDGKPNPAYYYSVCEMGFLQAFAEKCAEKFGILKEAGDNLHIVGGGITSPDNLLPHGECFIRNYLVGSLWVTAKLGLPMVNAWLPDDFGQDSQLPVLLEAMGFTGVSFWRVPGASPYSLQPVDGQPSVMEQLTDSGADFIWQAADGSKTIAHWLIGGYCQGDGINPSDGNKSAVNDQIASYLQTNEGPSKTPYIFVPVGCDFRIPQDLPSFANDWNTATSPPNQGYANTGVYVVAATFDQYLQLVSAWWQDNTSPEPYTLHAVPYHTGCYATRPLIKRMHYRATKALLGAEIFSIIANSQFQSDPAKRRSKTKADTAAQAACWNKLVPSTHHDYITGTALNPVYYGEQIPLLREAISQARSLRQTGIEEMAAAITASPESGEIAVAVFNQLGFDNKGLVKLPPSIALSSLIPNPNVVRTGETYAAAQPTADGGLLFFADVGSLGYSTYYVSYGTPQIPSQSVSITPTSGGSDSYTLSNGLIKVTISLSAHWGITEILDLQGSNPGANLLKTTANELVFYQETYDSTSGWGGTNYNFGNEAPSGVDYLKEVPPNLKNPTISILETGPLRVRVVTEVTFTEPLTKNEYVYTREYILIAGEPFIRMRTTGAAPFAPNQAGYSVAVEFPLAQAISPALIHGTTYHWDSTPQVRYWAKGPAFQATHDFVIAQSESGEMLGAILHGSVPAWGLGEAVNGKRWRLIGCLLRNLSGENFGYFDPVLPPNGIDPDSHTLEYAFRVPTGIQLPDTGAQLLESLAYHTPMIARALPVTTSRKLPESFVLAVVITSTGTQPIITAAKMGSVSPDDLILRIYQPYNHEVPITLVLPALQSGASVTAQVVTALEIPLDEQQQQEFNLQVSGNQITFNAQLALTTLAISQQSD